MKKILISLLLFVLSLSLSFIYFLNSDINPNIISYDHPVKNIIQNNGGLKGEFTAQNNYLGLLTIRFDNKDIIEKNSVFKIKEKISNTWYHISNIDAVQYNIKPLYTFGLPTITDSKNKTYQFEIVLSDYVSGDPNLMLSAHKPIVTSQYVYPWKVFLKDRHALLGFVQRKISYQLHSPFAPWVFFAYSLPLIGYLIYAFMLHKYIPLSISLKPIALIALLGISIDVFVLQNNYDILALILSLIWILGIFFHKVRPQTSILMALILLIWCPFFLIAHMEWVAEKSANWVFIFATIGFFQYFVMSIKHNEK